MNRDKFDKQIFLSHAWGIDSLGRDNHIRCKELYDLLVKNGYSVWFDDKDIKGNIDNSIIKGINNAKIILICLTEKYCNKINSAVNNNLPNDNCYKEWSYSLFKQKLIIPIIMDPNMQDIYTQGDGIIQMYLHNTLYIDLSDELSINLNKLISTLDYYNIYSRNSPNITPNNSNNSLLNLLIKNIDNKETERDNNPNSINSLPKEKFISEVSNKFKLPMNKNNNKKSFKIILNEKRKRNTKMIYNIFFKFGKLKPNKIKI